MNMACSTGYSAAAVTSPSFGRGLVRWAVLGAAGVIALILALSHSMVAGAQAPTTNCIPISYGNCVTTGAPFTNVGTTTITSNTGIPGNAAVSGPYFDPRYGFVQVVTDGSGNLIDINPQTGQRIYPVFPDFGIGGVIGNGFIGANFNNGFNGFNGNFVNRFNGFNGINANFVNGFNGFNGSFFNNATFFNNNGAFPAGATNIGGGVFTYNDNRFCGDGKLFFVVGRGSFCQNGGFANGNGGFSNANFRGFEVNTATPQQATTVTAKVAAPVVAQAAAPVVQAAVPVTQAAAPVVQSAAPVVQAAVAPKAAAPVVQAVVAPKAPVTAPAAAAPIVAKAQATTPVVSNGTADPDDHRG